MGTCMKKAKIVNVEENLYDIEYRIELDEMVGTNEVYICKYEDIKVFTLIVDDMPVISESYEDDWTDEKYIKYILNKFGYELEEEK